MGSKEENRRSSSSRKKKSSRIRNHSSEEDNSHSSERKMARKHRKSRRHSTSEDTQSSSSGSGADHTSSGEDHDQRKHKRKHSRDRSRKGVTKKQKQSDRERRRNKHSHGSKHRRDKAHTKNKHREGTESSNSEFESPSPEEVVSTILRKFPQVLDDLKQLLKMIDDGQAVDISGLANKHVALYLQELFRALKLHHTSTGLFLLPKGASKKTMDILGPTLQAHSSIVAMGLLTTQSEQDREGVLEGSRECDLLLAEASNEREVPLLDEVGPAEQKRRVIGPVMPSAETLAAAARLTDAGAALREAEEDLEHLPLIGPPPPAAVAEAESANEAERFEEVERILARDIENAYEVLNLKVGATPEMLKKRYWKLSLLVHPDKCSHPCAHQAFTALNQAFKDLQDPIKRSVIDHQIEEKETRAEFEAELKAKREAAQWRKLRGEPLPGDDAILDPPKAPTRDEWMTQLPPERQAGRPTMHSTFFSKSEKSGRGDTSVWTDTPLEKAEKAKKQYLEAYRQASLTASNEEADTSMKETKSQAAQMMDQFNTAKRGTSLLEKHQAERTRKPKKSMRKEEALPDWSSNHPWKPFDREKDLVSGRQNVKLDEGSMSQGLSARFSSSHEERSFL